MVWLRKTKTGGLFNTDWNDERKRQLDAAKSTAKELNDRNSKRDIDSTVQSLLEKAHAAEPQVTKDLQAAVGRRGASLAGLDFRFKGKGSLTDKLSRKAKEKNITPEEYAKRVTDVLRYTELSEEDRLYGNFRDFTSFMESKGYEMIEVNNTWYEGSVYKGINTLMRTPSGYTFEMQFHTPISLEIKEINHKLYEEVREGTASRERQIEINDQMRANAAQVPTPRDIDKIKDR